MNMWHYLDAILIALIVAVSAGYAVYSFSSIKLKRALLTLLVRVFGVRVFMLFSPRLGGCNACSASDARADVLRKLAADK
jgi:steroid 5-alpha reductase family enzyme